MQVNTSFAAQLYESAQRLSDPGKIDEAAKASKSFAEAMKAAAADMTRTIANGEQVATQAVSGKGDLQSVVEALSATQVALETVVTVRDKVVEAYKDILRMPV